MEVQSVVEAVFKQYRKANQNQLNDIFLEQSNMNGTPNFVYKSNTYILNSHKNSPIKPLHRSLKSKLLSYLDDKQQLQTVIETIVNYLINNKISTFDDFYFLLPSSCYQYLDEYFTNTHKPSMDIKPSNYDEISQMINEYMLMDLL